MPSPGPGTLGSVAALALSLGGCTPSSGPPSLPAGGLHHLSLCPPGTQAPSLQSNTCLGALARAVPSAWNACPFLCSALLALLLGCGQASRPGSHLSCVGSPGHPSTEPCAACQPGHAVRPAPPRGRTPFCAVRHVGGRGKPGPGRTGRFVPAGGWVGTGQEAGGWGGRACCSQTGRNPVSATRGRRGELLQSREASPQAKSPLGAEGARDDNRQPARQPTSVSGALEIRATWPGAPRPQLDTRPSEAPKTKDSTHPESVPVSQGPGWGVESSPRRLGGPPWPAPHRPRRSCVSIRPWAPRLPPATP